jgi:hypothetical protein
MQLFSIQAPCAQSVGEPRYVTWCVKKSAFADVLKQQSLARCIGCCDGNSGNEIGEQLVAETYIAVENVFALKRQANVRVATMR